MDLHCDVTRVASERACEEQVRGIIGDAAKEQRASGASSAAIETGMQLSVFERPLNQCDASSRSACARKQL